MEKTTYFWLGAALNVALVLGGFELFQSLAIGAGEIPPRGTHVWQGKAFLHWDHFMVQKVGDLVFLSLLDGCLLASLSDLSVGRAGKVLLVTLGVVAAVATAVWARSVQAQFAAGEFARWDWGFTAPAGNLTIAGKYHLCYFALQAFAIGATLTYLLWQAIGIPTKAGMVVALLGYAATAAYDAKSIGLSGGPFSGPKQVQSPKQ